MATAVAATSATGAARSLIHLIVCRQCQEFGEVFRERDLLEQCPRLIPLAARERVSAYELTDLRELFVRDTADELRRNARAALERAAMVQPLPDLGAADLARRRVLHQIVDRSS